LSTHDSICRRLDWDSEFFARNIARLNVERLTEDTAAQARAWCECNRIDCLYFLADATDPTTISLAENNGFHLVDVRFTLQLQLKDIPSITPIAGAIRLGTVSDGPVLRSIAGHSHRDSRFYYDAHFPRSQCDALYQTWIEKSLNGYAEAVLVAELEGEPVGYVSCHLSSPAVGKIGLFAVDFSARRKGLGQGLLHESVRWFASKGALRVTVVTQGHNVSAQRMYQRCGFETESLQLWYHRWFPRDGNIGA
jgi:dTDP-4-amino-4,6-dideoxy-D-galactose acyltransferase